MFTHAQLPYTQMLIDILLFIHENTHTLPFLSFFHILAPTCVHSGSRINTKAKVPQRGTGRGARMTER